MKRLIFALPLLAALASPALADRYQFDKEHTSIAFSVNHLGYSDMVGYFMDYDGELTFDQKAPEKSSVKMTIRPAGVRSISKGLDEHLQKPDFFNTEKFPEVTFVSTGIKTTGKNTADITGNLTLLGVTKPVVLKTRFNKADYRPMDNKYIAGFSADAVVKRSDFGMKQYVPMVGDDVRFHIEVEAENLDKPAGKPNEKK